MKTMDVTTAIIYFIVAYILYKIIDRCVRLPRLGNLHERYIVVTGCDSGFGHEAAKRLDKLGCHVFAACLTEKGETELRKHCSDRLRPLHLDVRDSESIKEAYAQVKKCLPKNKGLWGVLNNAAILGKVVPEEWLHMRDYQQVLDVNLLGLIEVTMTFLPLLKAEGGGRIVNTSSMTARCAWPSATAYCISKYGVECFSDSMRRQLRLYNVSVHLIEPGAFRTSMTEEQVLREALLEAWRQTPADAQDEYGSAYVHELLKLGRRQLDFFSPRLSDVVDAYTHALLGRFPRARYPVGLDATILITLATWLPEWLIDWLMHTATTFVYPAAVMDGRYKAKACS